HLLQLSKHPPTATGRLARTFHQRDHEADETSKYPFSVGNSGEAELMPPESLKTRHIPARLHERRSCPNHRSKSDAYRAGILLWHTSTSGAPCYEDDRQTASL